MTARYHRLSRAERRDQILDAANSLFAERGYEDVSVEDVASSAGVTRGLVHHYFGGRKGGLRRAGRAARCCPRGTAAAARGSQRPRPRGGLGITLAGLDRGQQDDLPRHDRTRRGHRGPGRAACGRRLGASRGRAGRALPLRPRPGLATVAPRSGVLDRPEPRRDTTLATRRGQPRGDPRAACLDPGAHSPHLRHATTPAHHFTRSRTLTRTVHDGDLWIDTPCLPDLAWAAVR